MGREPEKYLAEEKRRMKEGWRRGDKIDGKNLQRGYNWGEGVYNTKTWTDMDCSNVEGD
jgi:hypothetical protein